MPMPADTSDTARLRRVSNQPVTQAIIGAKIAAVAAPTTSPKTSWNSIRELAWLATAMLAVTIGNLTVAIVGDYLDFRVPQDDWRKDRPKLAEWQQRFASRPSMRETYPKDPS